MNILDCFVGIKFLLAMTKKLFCMLRFLSEAKGPSNPNLSLIKLTTGDITAQTVDAIVTLIPQNLEYRGSINTAILKAAGEKMDEFLLENIYRPRPGDAYAVPGFGLPCKNILFCVVPVWRSELDRDDKHLLIAVRKAMELARAMSLKTIAFPPLGAGKKSYPPARAARLMIQGITERIDEGFHEIHITCRDKDTMYHYRERLLSTGWMG
jgi:O-acetyl-ADP-ribose deacetylase (regulator of RNase III)